ncbi:MAG: nicotinate (nicotinamide) nucleotide adenylyltransferase [Oscillospiraceae bacterium]|nr:nicotinate (nicotinamide) nucleotide adenylyltransferase [Oscillospiraceae bacterium]
MKIGIYGGTFDPPHIGHEAAARAAVSRLGLDRLILIPTSTPPHKELAAGSCTARERLEMTRLCARGIPNAEASDIEIARGGRSYTADTVAALRERYPDGRFYLLMGTDMFLSVEQWRDFRTLLAQVTPAVFSRAGGDAESIAAFAAVLRERYGAEAELIPHEPVEISSTQVRALLPERQGRRYLSPAVYAYIIRKRAYGAKPELPWLREQAYARLKEKRVPHVMGCEEEAARLSKRWGASVQDAREAAILHDVTKKESLETQLHLCAKYDIINDTAEAASANLLHAKTGAAVAGAEFGMSEAVCSAIRWHTTGRAGMTLLEKILYMADYIEPTRDFEGVEALRRLAYEDLDAAVLLGLEMGLEDLKQRGIKPHEASLKAMEYLSEKRTKA